jgi:hypothetical protein
MFRGHMTSQFSNRPFSIQLGTMWPEFFDEKYKGPINGATVVFRKEK